MAKRDGARAREAVLDIDRRLEVAGALQEFLVDLVELSLQGKQAHWNLHGPMFRDLHLLLDELVEQARASADRAAERCLALNVAADGRSSTVAADTRLEPFPEGRIDDRQVVEHMVSRLTTVSETGRSRLELLGDADLVSQDLVIEVLGELEKLRWMFDAHR